MSTLKSKKTEIFSVLLGGGIVFMPTDTIPGLVCLAQNEQAVNRIFALKNRDFNKPPTIIISKIEQIDDLGLVIPKLLDTKEYWPGPICLVLDFKQKKNSKFRYLHRDLKSLAVRLTSNNELAEIIDKVGPIASSSANIQGKNPAKTINGARQYFGEAVDLYVEPDYISKKPSTIIKIYKDGSKEVIRN